MWHASVAPCGCRPHVNDLRRLALVALAGVGDRDHEWAEFTGYAYHVRRRLTVEEQNLVGDAVDCRGSEEGQRRFEAVKSLLPAAALRLAQEELSECGRVAK